MTICKTLVLHLLYIFLLSYFCCLLYLPCTFQTMNEASSLLSATCNTFIKTLEDCMRIANSNFKTDLLQLTPPDPLMSPVSPSPIQMARVHQPHTYSHAQTYTKLLLYVFIQKLYLFINVFCVVDFSVLLRHILCDICDILLITIQSNVTVKGNNLSWYKCAKVINFSSSQQIVEDKNVDVFLSYVADKLLQKKKILSQQICQ